MCIENWIPAITTSTFSIGLVGLVLFLSRNLIINRLTKSVKHEYDTKLANINARIDNEKNERQSIRDFLYNNLQQRQNLLYEKQIQAVDKIWEATYNLHHGEFLCGMLLRFKLDKVSATIERDHKLQKLFEYFSQHVDLEKMSSINTYILKPYLPELLYTYYEAYNSIILHYVLLAQLFKTGLKDNFLDKKNIKKVILATLPHQKDFIEKYDVHASGDLLEELREKILHEIKLFLSGKSNTTSNIQQVKEMQVALKDINDSNQELNKKLTS